MGTCGLAHFTELVFPEASSLGPVLFSTGTRRKYAWPWYSEGYLYMGEVGSLGALAGKGHKVLSGVLKVSIP